MSLSGKTIIVTGAAKRIGRYLALTLADAGANIVLQYSQSKDEALLTAEEIEKKGVKAFLYQVEFSNEENVKVFIEDVLNMTDIYGLVNNASIFESATFGSTTIDAWQRHLNINLTAPFILSQCFGFRNKGVRKGRIVNILDWRAIRPGEDHFAYTISKSALGSMTLSMAQALAPDITVNGLALGAILPPIDGADHEKLIQNVPAKRWGKLEEVGEALLFLMDGPEFITGEILHIDGGRHLT